MAWYTGQYKEIASLTAKEAMRAPDAHTMASGLAHTIAAHQKSQPKVDECNRIPCLRFFAISK